VSFLFNALIDVKVLPGYNHGCNLGCQSLCVQVLSEKSVLTWLLMLAAYVAVFLGYFKYNISYVIIYLDVIVVCCGSWVVIELGKCLLLKKWTGFGWLCAAALSGGLSLGLFKYFGCWLCHNLGPSSGESIWLVLGVLFVCFTQLSGFKVLRLGCCCSVFDRVDAQDTRACKQGAIDLDSAERSSREGQSHGACGGDVCCHRRCQSVTVGHNAKVLDRTCCMGVSVELSEAWRTFTTPGNRLQSLLLVPCFQFEFDLFVRT
jgi:D-alanyl-lipoteichoic acid acyltransferase DltB (MBOAT superfamily)